MFKLRKLFVYLFVVLTFVFILSLHSQTTSVSANITDSDGTEWSGGTWFAKFIPNPNQSNPCNYQLQGQSLCSAQWDSYLSQSGTLDNSGNLAITLLDNNQISPVGSKWVFTIQSKTVAPATQYSPITITGSSQNLTTYLSSNSVAPRFPALGFNYYGYADVEISPTPNPGGTYFNITQNCYRVWSGSWSCIAGNSNINLQNFEGTLYADQWQNPIGTGNNGISLSMAECAILSYPCKVVAPVLYSRTESQPYGGFFQFVSSGISAGPKASDPIGGFLDERWGVPEWIFNSSQNIDTRHNASPGFIMNFVGQSSLTGTFVDLAPVLQLTANYFAGGRTFGVSDNMNAPGATLQYDAWTAIQGGGAWGVAANCYGGGDCLREGGDIVGYGGPTPEVGEGIEGANHEVTMGTHVFTANVSGTPSVGGDGTTTLVTASQVNNGTQGEDRILTDVTSVYNTGYISAIVQGSNVDLSATCAGGCNWDSTFGLSTKTTLSTAIVNPINGTNSFPQSSVNMTVASSTGFTVGHMACVYDYNYECELISAIPDGTHITLATVRMPHVVGAYITTGGLAGYVIRFEADDCTSANGCRGMQLAGHYSALFGNTLYYELPIMYSSTGDVAWIFQGGNSLPGVGGTYNGSAYSQMAGSGGTCSVTVSAGAIATVTVSGGTGYLGNDPPQLVLSGITYTTAPVLYVNGSNGALSSAAIYNAGSGISGTPTCTVVTSNPYDIYDAAKVTQVWNPTTGKVDGSQIVTEPWPVTPSNGDGLQEQPYYYEHTSADVIGGVGQYFPSLGDEGLAAYGGSLYGVYQGNDVALSWSSSTTPNLFSGSPGPQILGYGQYLTPIFSNIKLPSRIYRNYAYPPFAPNGNGGSNISGYNPAVDNITCGTQWKNPWWMQTFNGTQQNGWMANCSTDTIYGVIKNLDLSEVTNLNLGNPIITTNGGFNSGLQQNWNANSDTFTAASWNSGTCGGSSATITADPTVTDPYGGHNAYKVVTTNHGAGSCIDVDTGTPLTNGGIYSGHIWALDPSGQICIGIGNNGNCGPVSSATWQKISISSITPNPSLLTNTFDFYDDLGNNTYWVYNAVTSNTPIDIGELITGNTQQTTSIQVNQINGSSICRADGTNCPPGSGNVSDGSGTSTPNQIATSTNTTHTIQYGTAIPNGTTATTQTSGDNTTKVATDAFVLANAGSVSYPASASYIGTNVSSVPIAVTAGSKRVRNAVLDCSVDNTGATDTSSAIATCINNLPSGGGGIYFPEGLYKINAGVTITATNSNHYGIKIYGSSMHGTVFESNCSGTNPYPFWFDDTTSNASNPWGPTIEDITIEDTSGTGACAGGIRITQFENLKLHRINYQGFSGITYTNGSASLTVTNGSTAVTCTGCAFTSAMVPGLLWVNGLPQEVTTYNSATSLTLTSPYQQTTYTGNNFSYDYNGNCLWLEGTSANGFAQYGTVSDMYATTCKIGVYGEGGTTSAQGISRFKFIGGFINNERVANSLGFFFGQYGDTEEWDIPVNNAAFYGVLENTHLNKISGEFEDDSPATVVTTCNGGVASQACSVGTYVVGSSTTLSFNNLITGSSMNKTGVGVEWTSNVYQLQVKDNRFYSNSFGSGDPFYTAVFSPPSSGNGLTTALIDDPTWKTGTTGNIGGSVLSNSCSTGTVTILGAYAGKTAVAVASDGSTMNPFTISAVGTGNQTVTVSVCGTGTPTAKTYNVTLQ